MSKDAKGHGSARKGETKAIMKKAEQAKADQVKAMNSEKDPFKAYWAGSASASVAHHYKRGAVVDIKVKPRKSSTAAQRRKALSGGPIKR